MELDELDLELGPSASSPSSSHAHEGGDPRLMTFGLVLHSLADGLALGASLSEQTEDSKGSSGLSGLSAVVFLALALHKGSSSPLLPSFACSKTHQTLQSSSSSPSPNINTNGAPPTTPRPRAPPRILARRAS